MKKIRKFLIVLFIAISLITGAKYISGTKNLNQVELSPANINNIVTPLAAIFSAIVTSFALILAIQQNRILRSQHLRPYYEKEIKRYLDSLSAKDIYQDFLPVKYKVYNGLTFIKLIQQMKLDLIADGEYQEDVQKYENGEELNHDYFKKRSYYPIVFFLFGYVQGLYNMFHFDDLKTLIKEINYSGLSNEDKSQLKKRIRREFLEDYISFISYEKSYPSTHPPIPILYTYQLNGPVEFKIMSQTGFSDHYKWFKRELGN